MARWDRAAWRPLPENATEGANNPVLVIFHTMVGSQNGTEQWFKREDVKSESHFGIAEDPSTTDPIRQWIDTAREADTNWDANGHSVTAELEDKGDPSRPLTPFQLEACIDLGVWALREHPEIPARVATADDKRGLGWHELFPEWNRSNHRCPGPVREQQLTEIVFPQIIERVQEPPMFDAVILTHPSSAAVDEFAASAGLLIRPDQRVIHVVNVDIARDAMRAGKRVHAVGGEACALIEGDHDLAGANRLETFEKVIAQAEQGW